jgi:transposase-like protein
MWLPAVNHKEIHNDVPQLADRHVKAGFYGKTNRVQRWKCQQCGKRTTTASGMLTHLSP